MSPVALNTHAQSQLSTSDERITFYLLIYSDPASFYTSYLLFPIFVSFFSVEYFFPSEINLGFLTASWAFNTGKHPASLLERRCQVVNVQTELDKSFGKKLYIYLQLRALHSSAVTCCFSSLYGPGIRQQFYFENNFLSQLFFSLFSHF